MDTGWVEGRCDVGGWAEAEYPGGARMGWTSEVEMPRRDSIVVLSCRLVRYMNHFVLRG